MASRDEVTKIYQLRDTGPLEVVVICLPLSVVHTLDITEATEGHLPVVLTPMKAW